MSRFTGPQGKGALARHRATARAAAEARQAAFDAEVARIEREQHLDDQPDLARRVAAISGRLARRRGPRRATAPVTTPAPLEQPAAEDGAP